MVENSDSASASPHHEMRSNGWATVNESSRVLNVLNGSVRVLVIWGCPLVKTFEHMHLLSVLQYIEAVELRWHKRWQ